MGDPYAPRSPDLSTSLFSHPSQPQSAKAKHMPQGQQSYPHNSSYALPQHHSHSSYAPSSQHVYQQPSHHGSYAPNYENIPPMQQQQPPPPPPPQQQRQQRGSRTAKLEPDDLPWLPPSESQPTHSRSVKQQSSKVGSASVMAKKERIQAPGEAEGIVVRTKFPVARIKRIVQADEDVGKVAQVTPVVVSKALELFMISLTLKSAAVARSKSSKRITAAHLKQAVLAEPQFDFLSEIVNKVPDAPASKDQQQPSAGKKEEEMEWKGEGSGDEWGGGETKGKRKRAAPGAGRRRARGGGGDDE